MKGILDSLSYKLEPPTSRSLTQNKIDLPKQNFAMFQQPIQKRQQQQKCQRGNNTQEFGVKEEQETLNPFRKTTNLFKYVSGNKSRSQLSNAYEYSQNTLPHFNQAFSLQNFDSFQNKSTKILKSHKKEEPGAINGAQNFLSFKGSPQNHGYKSNSDKFIKIQNNEPGEIDDYSIIMDDYNSTLKVSDILQDSKQNFRSKTQPNQNQDSNDKFPLKLNNSIKNQTKYSSKPKQAQKKAGNFFLTQESETYTQSGIREFYMDLRDETKLFSSLPKEKSDEENNPPNQQLNDGFKKKIKQLIYNFVDQIDIVDQKNINPLFVGELEQCLKSFIVKERQSQQFTPEITPKKWNKSQKKDYLLKSNILSENKQTLNQKNQGIKFFKKNSMGQKFQIKTKQNFCKNSPCKQLGIKNQKPVNSNKKWCKTQTSQYSRSSVSLVGIRQKPLFK